VVYVVEFFGARMSTLSVTIPPGGTLMGSCSSGYNASLLPPKKVNKTDPGNHVAEPVFSTCQPIVNRSPAVIWEPFAMDCMSRLQSSGPVGVFDAVGLKNSTMGVNVTVGAGVTEAVGVSDIVASGVAAGFGVSVAVDGGKVDRERVDVLVGAFVGVAVGGWAAHAPSTNTSAVITIAFLISMPFLFDDRQYVRRKPAAIAGHARSRTRTSQGTDQQTPQSRSTRNDRLASVTQALFSQ
jgi:hypothetical protein